MLLVPISWALAIYIYIYTECIYIYIYIYIYIHTHITKLMQALRGGGGGKQCCHVAVNKLCRQLCDNYRGISVVTTEGKILARVQLNRLSLRTCLHFERARVAPELSPGQLDRCRLHKLEEKI